MRKAIRQVGKRLSRRPVLTSTVLLLLLAYIFCLPRTLFRPAYSTVVTDAQGELLGARIASDGQWRFPTRKSVPAKLARCLERFEDKRFRYHWGVDPLALGRAIVSNWRQGRIVSGGSTLTMQTVRLARSRPRTWSEKLIEAIWATRLEFRMSKDEILSLYVSHAPFGGNVVGVDAASWRYFGRSPEDLSWAESALLAVLPNAPATIHLSKSRPALLAKRNNLLKRLYEDGSLDASTYELAVNEPLPSAPHPLPSVAPHWVDKLNAEYKGRRLCSTLDKTLQLQVEQLAARWNREFARSDIRHLAVLVLDLKTQEVVAYCGNVGYGVSAGSQVDVVRSPRSSGSILKPFLYYAALKEGQILPHNLLPDVPLNVNGFAPQNFSREFEGAVPASEALARSLNIPAVHLLQRYGVPKFHDLLREMGISTLTRSASHYGLSLILGGGEVTLWDVTTAYAALGASLDKASKQPFAPRWVKGEEATHKLSHAWDKAAAWQTVEALKAVNRPEEIDLSLLPSVQPVAWKTGTSYGFRDAWAVGITTHHAVGVWVGNATGEGKPGLTGAQTAAPVMFDVFNLLPSVPWFKRPSGVLVGAEVCRQSGCLKGRFCTEVDTLLIHPSGQRSEVCPYHRPILLTADGSYRLYEQCADGEPVLRHSWFVLPPVWEWYYRHHHPDYRPLPPMKPGCEADTSAPMAFIYPSAGARIKLTRGLDGNEGAVHAELAHSQSSSIVYWHLDNRFLGTTQDFHKKPIQAAPGKHSLTAVDEQGNTISVSFYID